MSLSRGGETRMHGNRFLILSCPLWLCHFLPYFTCLPSVCEWESRVSDPWRQMASHLGSLLWLSHFLLNSFHICCQRESCSMWGQMSLPGLQSLNRSWVRKYWVSMAMPCWVRESKLSCCSPVPLVMGSQASLPFFFNHLLFLSLVPFIGFIHLYPLVRDEVIWINFWNIWKYFISWFVVVVTRLNTFVRIH